MFLTFTPGFLVFAENLAPNETLKALQKENKDAFSEKRKMLKEDVFSVSSEDLDPAESLNRVAGNRDRGYSSPEQSFKSIEQSAPGPTGREKSALASQKSY